MVRQAKGNSRIRRFGAAAGLAVLVGTGACLATADRGDPGDEVTAQELAAPGGHHRFGDPVTVVVDAAMAYGNPTLEQAEILTAIEQEVVDERDLQHQTRESLRASAAEIVRAGTADSEQFDQTVDEAMAAIEAHMARTADAIEEIHATLDADQRAAVAEALREKVAERFGHRHDGKRHRDRFGRFAAHLMLSALQIDELKTIRKEMLGERDRLRPREEELLALVDAFEGEQFAPALEAFRVAKTSLIRERFADAAERAETALSIFTPGQRELLADLVKDGPQKVLLGDEPKPPRDER